MKSYKLKELIDNIIKDEQSKNEKWVNFECFETDLNIDSNILYDINADLNTDLRSYRIASHICTDTEVGILAYFLKDEFVCITKQSARKSPEIIIGWSSQEMADKTREYILSLQRIEEVDNSVELLDMEFDMGEGYQVEYTEQMTSKKVLYNNQVCTVLEDKSNGYKNFHNIVIGINGESVGVDIRNCNTPYRIQENINLFKN